LFLLSTDFENKNTLGLSGFCFKTCCLKFNWHFKALLFSNQRYIWQF
jgi:hypothetical protein